MVLTNLVQDFRYGIRVLAKHRGYTAVAALTVALAIGANTVIFSFANILLLRPLPIAKSDEMAWIWWTNARRTVDRGGLSMPDFLDLRREQTTCESLAAFRRGDYTLTGRGDARRLVAMRVSANLLTSWRVQPLLGRAFVDGEDAIGAAPVVMLSHRYWASVFNESPAAIGDRLVLDGVPHTIVGVLAPDIEIGNLVKLDVWSPLTLDPSLPRDDRGLRVAGRRKPGVTLDRVDAEAKALARRLETDHPTTNAGWSARVVPTRIAITGNNTWTLIGLLALVVGFVLFIACANLANLMLVRGSGRRKEIAVRAALGAGRLRIVGQLMSESLVIGLIGGACGLAIASAGLRLMRAASDDTFFQWVTIDGRVLAFTFVLSLVTPLVFSVVPAFQAARRDLTDALRDGARGSGDARSNRGRAVLVVSQLTLALALMIVAGLTVRAMIAMARAPLGFDQHNLLTMRAELPAWKYRSDAEVMRFWDGLLPALSSVPGVSAIAAGSRTPVVDSGTTASLDIEGRPAERPEDRPWALSSAATSDYFKTIGIPVLAGRPFREADRAEAPLVAVINDEMARRYWRSRSDAIGARIRPAVGPGTGRWSTVVGVVASVMRPDLKGADPELYLPATQHAQRLLTILVRGEAPASLASTLRARIRNADVDVPVDPIRTLDEALESDLSSTRVLIGMFVSFGLLALALAASGLYGVMSYVVSQRVKEFGIRMALGATPGQIRSMVRGQSARLVAVGLVLGLLAGGALSRLTASILYGVSPLDPLTFAGGTCALIVVAILASTVPIRRATEVDPTTALRAE